MVDSVNPGSNSLLRAQQAAQISSVHRQTNHTVINQTKQASVVPVKAQAVPQSIKLAGTENNRPLPRGSLVDTIV